MTTLADTSVETNWINREFKNLGIRCGRTIKRFIKTMGTLSNNIQASILGASENVAEAKAIYNMLKNETLTEPLILASHCKATLQQIKESKSDIILAIQDTTEVNYTSHHKTKGLGDGTAKNTKALFVHSTVAVPSSGLPFGLLDQQIWARDPEERGQRKANRPIEEKESYKWFTSMERVAALQFPEGTRVVHVGDREADIYELFEYASRIRQDVLVRIVRNRNTDEDLKLFEQLEQTKVEGTIIVDIPRDTRRNIPARTATLELRYKKVKVRVPQNLHSQYGAQHSLTLTYILVREIDAPEGLEPIEWYLGTTLDVNSAEEAAEKVSWYVQRWKIERFHYVLKQGCAVEELQARSAEILSKEILMYSIIAVRLLHLTYAARQTPNVLCDMIFDSEEWQVLFCIANKTKQPPQIAPTIQEVVRYLAKLGGFAGRKGDGDPGVKVIWRGYSVLQTVLNHYAFIPR